MSRAKRPQAYRVSEPPAGKAELNAADPEPAQSIELREEQLVARKELREVGNVEVRTELDDVPGRLEVDAYREEVEIEHEPVGQVVSERGQPSEENGVLIVPIYEEQLVVTKRLVLRERLRIRRVGTTDRRLFEESLRRERLVVDDPQHTGLVHERYPTGEVGEEDPPNEDAAEAHRGQPDEQPDGGFLGHVVRKALE
ncbi:MAG: YsnF/AvaK domain-containing protein [Chloroflexi bacterium]|nr:YsnF/AvaK domain-containing protein [Chloroflexota bacterium]